MGWDGMGWDERRGEERRGEDRKGPHGPGTFTSVVEGVCCEYRCTFVLGILHHATLRYATIHFVHSRLFLR